MQDTSSLHNYTIFSIPFWMGKVGKEEGESPKIENYENKKGLLDEIKSIFHVF